METINKKTTDLNFYTRPFHQGRHGTWVYDAKGNFVFEFNKSLPQEERDLIIFRLNALVKESETIPKYDLIYAASHTMITNNGENFIEIRGWGNLTGIGANNFSLDKAAKIQDDFAAWIIDRLTD